MEWLVLWYNDIVTHVHGLRIWSVMNVTLLLQLVLLLFFGKIVIFIDKHLTLVTCVMCCCCCCRRMCRNSSKIETSSVFLKSSFRLVYLFISLNNCLFFLRYLVKSLEIVCADVCLSVLANRFVVVVVVDRKNCWCCCYCCRCFSFPCEQIQIIILVSKFS